MQVLSLWVKSKLIEEIRGDDLKMKIHKAVVFAPVIGVQALRPRPPLARPSENSAHLRYQARQHASDLMPQIHMIGFLQERRPLTILTRVFL